MLPSILRTNSAKPNPIESDQIPFIGYYQCTASLIGQSPPLIVYNASPFLGPSIAPLSLELTTTHIHPQQASQLILEIIVDTALLVDLTPLLDSNTRLHIPGENDFHLAISSITPFISKRH